MLKSMEKHKQLETMEEVVKCIRRACELAQNLESELPNMRNQASTLCLSIDEIAEALSAAKERVLLMCRQEQTSASSMMQLHETQMDATLMHEWLSSSHALSMDQMVQMQQQQQHHDVKSTLGDVIGGKDVEDSERSKGSEGEVQPIEASSSRPRRRSREGDMEKRKKIVPAPLFGNTDMPPEDGFTWRKYGQKDILGSKYPRSYYRCTHKKLYECQAKKQVQRHDHNPYFFQVTYRGNHTCHISLTAPSSVPPQQLPWDITHNSNTVSSQLSPSMKLSLQAGGDSSGSGGASTSKYGADYPVVDMADAMFNSGSSSGNSMESLFPPPEDK